MSARWRVAPLLGLLGGCLWPAAAQAQTCSSPIYFCAPSDASVFYDVAWVPPHNSTIHLLYTVPSGRMAYVGGIYLRVRRDGATSTPGFMGDEVYILKGGTTQVTLIDENTNSGTIGDQSKDTLAADFYLMPGDQVVELDDDTSVGGSGRFTASVAITEFAN